MKYPKRLSQRDVRNQLETFRALATGEVPTFEQPTARNKPHGPQKETSVVKSVQSLWSAIRRGALYRNRRGMVQLSTGAMMPIGLGPNGTGDVVGYSLVRVSPAMVGKVLPIYTELEGKTDAGRLAPHQVTRIEELRDINAIAGCVRSQDDADAVYRRWIDKQEQGER
jgi:hypothetical protein